MVKPLVKWSGGKSDEISKFMVIVRLVGKNMRN